MKRKIISLLITVLMIVTLIPGNVFAGSSTPQQLYWIYSGDVESIDDDGKINGVEDELYIAENPEVIYFHGDHWGYFAYKSGEDCYAVKQVKLINNADVYTLKPDTEDEYQYRLSWSQKGSCTARATVGETVYEMQIEFALPYTGAYSSKEPTEAAYLDGEFHFADADTAKDGNGNAYFYLIAEADDYYTPSSVKAVAGDWTESGWKDEDIAGINFGNVEKITYGGSNYYVSKVTVTKEFRSNDYMGYCIGFKTTGGEIIGIHYINIYDSTEMPADSQLYWFDEWTVNNVNEQGVITPYEGEELNQLAKRNIKLDLNSKKQGYFAVKDKDRDSYRAVKENITAKETDGIKGAFNNQDSDEDKYKYTIEGIKEGEYIGQFTYSENGNEYKLSASVQLPEIGFYSTDKLSADALLYDEFHFADGAKDENGNAYFYMIALDYGWDIDTTHAVVSGGITGITAGEVEQFGTSYLGCRITVSPEYKQSSDGWIDISLESRNGNYSSSICVFDSTEYSSDKQLYRFDYWDVDVESDGLLSLVADSYYNSLDDAAERVWRSNEKRDSMSGCFAVKVDDKYYVVDLDNEQGQKDNFRLEKDANNRYEYEAVWTQFGTYQLKATYKGSEYMFNIVVDLPEAGFYSSNLRTLDSYLDGEFHFVNAKQKSYDGEKAYFYLIGNSRYRNCYPAVVDEAGSSVKIDGLSFEKLDESTYEKQVWKITVTSNYRMESFETVQIGWFYDDGNDLRSTEEIKIYDSTEIPEDEQLYWFGDSKSNVQLIEGGDGQLESLDATTLDEYAAKEVETLNKTEEGYFAVKTGENEYYIVDSVNADGFVLRKNKDTGKYTVKRTNFGKYSCNATYQGKSYRMNVVFELPNSGFYTSIGEQSEETFLEEFDCNTDDNRIFYYICADESFDAVGVANVTSAKVLGANDDQEIAGIKITDSGEIRDTYYYWKLEVDDSKYNYNNEIYIDFHYGADGWASSDNIRVLGIVKDGDVDTNGVINIADALWLKRHLAQWDGYENIYKRAADLNKDGELSADDIMILERHIAGWAKYENLPYIAAE